MVFREENGLYSYDSAGLVPLSILVFRILCFTGIKMSSFITFSINKLFILAEISSCFINCTLSHSFVGRGRLFSEKNIGSQLLKQILVVINKWLLVLCFAVIFFYNINLGT